MTEIETPAWLDRRAYPFAPHTLEVRGLAPQQRCIAFDHIGFGLSDKPRDWPYTPDRHAANLGALVEHLGLDPVTLVVHDWGGPIGLGWATANRERVRRIVALDTWMWSMAEHRAGRWFSRILGSGLGQLATRRLDLFVRVFLRAGLGDAWPAVAASYRGPLARPADRQGCALFPRMLRHPWLDEIWQRRSALADVPARLVWGGADPAFPAAMRERLASVFRHVEVSVHEGVGHFVAEELADRLVPFVRG